MADEASLSSHRVCKLLKYLADAFMVLVGHTELLVVLSQIEMSNNNLYIFEILTP